jgi:hypothetical protein
MMEITFTWQEAQREYWVAGLSDFEKSAAFPPPPDVLPQKKRGHRRKSFSPSEITEMQSLLDKGLSRPEVARWFATYPALIHSYIGRGLLSYENTDKRRRKERCRKILDLWNEGYSKDMILNKGYTTGEVQSALYCYYKDERISAKEHDIKKRELRKELIRTGAEDELSLRSQKTKSALASGTRKAVKQGQD